MSQSIKILPDGSLPPPADSARKRKNTVTRQDFPQAVFSIVSESKSNTWCVRMHVSVPNPRPLYSCHLHQLCLVLSPSFSYSPTLGGLEAVLMWGRGLVWVCREGRHGDYQGVLL